MLENIKRMFIREEWLIYIWNLIPILLIAIMAIVCIIGIIGFTMDYYEERKNGKERRIRYKEENEKLKESEEYVNEISRTFDAHTLFYEIYKDEDIDKLREAIKAVEEKFPDITVGYYVEIYNISFINKRQEEIRKKVLGK